MKAILFDLDGTLHDRNTTIRAWLTRHTERFGLPEGYAPRFLQLDDFGYRSKSEVIPLLVQELGLPHAPKELLADFSTHFDMAQPMSYAHEVLRELRRRDIRIGIVTNGWQDAQTRCLAACRLAPLVDDVVISKSVGLSKPDPRIYQLALERLEATAQDTWFVGDSPRNDVWGPQQVGMRAALLPTGHAVKDEKPEAVLGDLRDVLTLP